MQLPIYQVDAFTDKLFGGNPAAVVPLKTWLSDEIMQKIAFENNLSETAFFVPNETGFDIRWFTPTVEVNLCGHATLATSFFGALFFAGAFADGFATDLVGVLATDLVAAFLAGVLDAGNFLAAAFFAVLTAVFFAGFGFLAVATKPLFSLAQ